MGKLVLHLPDGSTRDIPLTRERMTIGRRGDNDICVPLPTVSGEHAAVVTVLDDSFLEDLGSRNGTLVNGKPVKKHFLRDHDEIDIGHQRLVYVSGAFVVDDAPAAEAERSPTSGAAARPPTRAGSRQDSTMAVAPDTSSDRMMIDTSALFGPADEAPDRGVLRADAPSLEVLEGPSAGRVERIDVDEFVTGRLGTQLATIRRTPDGYRLVQVEGEAPPVLNGAPLPQEGALLARGDEIVVAGIRLRYRAGDPA